MASVHPYTQADGSTWWYVSYRTSKGKLTKKRGFPTEKAAQTYRATVEVDTRRGEFIDPHAGKVLVSAIIPEYLGSLHNLTASTRDRYTGIANGAITRRFGDTPVGKVTRAEVRTWVTEQVDADTPAETVHKQVGVLRRIMAVAVEDEKIRRNPVEGVRLPAITPEEMRFLTLPQLKQLATAAEGYEALIWTLGVCGLRLGEAAELRHRDIDRAHQSLRIARSATTVGGKIVVGKTKSKVARDVPIPTQIISMIPKGSPDALVFPAPQGGHLRGSNFRTRTFTPAVTKAKLFPSQVTDEDGKVRTVYDLHPHELRHTAASLAIADGANIMRVRNMLGHKRASLTLDRYGHLYPSDTSDMAASLGRMIEGFI
ncbi:tyrosine-type recombinase/integrase [Tsukamurella ocularis]